MDISSKIKDDHYVFDEFDYLVMALEDRRYLTHGGIDLCSIVREMVKIVSFKKHGGASTIDMQMVRTITNYKELTIKRKMYEMTLAILINFKFTKNQIMQCYMDNAFFGSHLIGASSTSRKIYNKEIHELNSLDKAKLAAMLLKPRPKKPSEEWFLSVQSRAIYAQSKRRFVKQGD
ncbi:biosynthetic peptidoglycan transglycosylase [Pantoea sp.]|uniref:biosynthetic peptidoglycan transglycosylase n=1 Tax=Pantoea sp. TaxID=69393 RepID=UPI0031D010A6